MFYEFQAKIRPGDLVFSSDRSKLSSWLIPGQWDHVAVVNDLGLIVEAHQPVVRQITPFEFCHTSDVVGIARAKDLRIARYFARECIRFLGLPYDSLFAKGREALYCSELVWEMDPDNELGFNDADSSGLGVPYVSPDGLWCATNVEHILGGEA